MFEKSAFSWGFARFLRACKHSACRIELKFQGPETVGKGIPIWYENDMVHGLAWSFVRVFILTVGQQ